MKRGALAALAGISAAALLLLALGRVKMARQQRQRDADDLKRWEGEGGLPRANDSEADRNAA